MGHVVRFTMVFRSRWWERSGVDGVETLNFVFTPGRMPPVWWTAMREGEGLPALTGWVGGPRCEALMGKSAGELGRIGAEALAQAFGMPEDLVRAELVETVSHDWSGDAFAQGAYSYVPAGAMEASGLMAEPELGTMFFAGEHADVTGHWGTVHAAIRSGLRVAEQCGGRQCRQ